MILGEDYELEFGRGALLREGHDLAIAACGVEVAQALEAAERLDKQGVSARVLNLASVDPIDESLLSDAAAECGAILTVEEHQIRGGLGDAVAQAVARTCPVPIEMLGMDDSFGQSGEAQELLAHYGLDAAGIVAAAGRLMQRQG